MVSQLYTFSSSFKSNVNMGQKMIINNVLIFFQIFPHTLVYWVNNTRQKSHVSPRNWCWWWWQDGKDAALLDPHQIFRCRPVKSVVAFLCHERHQTLAAFYRDHLPREPAVVKYDGYITVNWKKETNSNCQNFHNFSGVMWDELFLL